MEKTKKNESAASGVSFPHGPRNVSVVREYRARDLSEPAAEIQHEQEDEHRRDRHQRSLKDIVVDPGENSARRGVRERHSHADPDSPAEADAEDRIDHDSHRQRVRRHVANDSHEHRDGSESLRRTAIGSARRLRRES